MLDIEGNSSNLVELANTSFAKSANLFRPQVLVYSLVTIEKSLSVDEVLVTDEGLTFNEATTKDGLTVGEVIADNEDFLFLVLFSNLATKVLAILIDLLASRGVLFSQGTFIGIFVSNNDF
ncbi:11145_t:CDS:1 [Scutellospora calospora]|uniref:11145_t:CDS:1 n=1 Tax=Scutellospora calospora TaxID=85575 RepID=A0ACA9LMC2_9GLOM|nr:11145_t:CDS:1 [Scutellospora calospora]